MVHVPLFFREIEGETEDRKLTALRTGGRADKVSHWSHDRYREDEQKPKGKNELVNRYGLVWVTLVCMRTHFLKLFKVEEKSFSERVQWKKNI